MSSPGRVVLKPRRARPFFARHPWVFEASIERVVGEPGPGDQVDVESHDGQFIARGLYNPVSTIRVRLYRWDDGPLDDAFWSKSLAAAVRLRCEVLGLGRKDKSAYRLVFSEGDGLSGLTVDRYDRWLSRPIQQSGSLSTSRRHPAIAQRIDRSRRHHCSNRARNCPEGRPSIGPGRDHRIDPRSTGRDRRKRTDATRSTSALARKQAFIWIKGRIAGSSPVIAGASGYSTCFVSPVGSRSTRSSTVGRLRLSASTARHP